MNTVEKIIQLIKNDKEIAKNLFLFSEFPEDVKLWTGLEQDNFDYTNIKWLFATNQENLNLIGVNTLDNTVWCIDNEGDFHQDCDSLENLPYEMLRTECFYTNNGTVSEYFQKYKEYQQNLARYEKWCKEHDIVLDKNKIYHNQNGDLFKECFEKNEDI